MPTPPFSTRRNHVALVFCGGKGTRMQPISSLIRKEMLPIGRQMKPLLAHVVEHLKHHGIRQIAFIGSRSDGGDIANYFGDGRRFGVRIIHQPDPARCLGTGHALLWAIKRLRLKGRHVLVYYGDIYNTVNLRELAEVHASRGSTATIVVSDQYVLPKGVAMVAASGIVSSFREKPRWQGPGKVAVGLLCIDVDRLVNACNGLPSSVEHLCRSPFKDIMGDVVRHLVERSEVSAYTTRACWRDIGSFVDYLDVQRESELEEHQVPGRKLWSAAPTDPSLTVFLSYNIGGGNRKVVEDLLSPCLRYAGYGVVSGATLNRGRIAPPSTRARQEIDRCDVLVAIATPVGRDRKPSTYVIDEVTYALAKGKKVLPFIEEGTKIPGHWREQFTWTPFVRTKLATLVRDVLEMIAKVD